MIIPSMCAHYKLNDNAASTTVVNSAGTLNGVATVNTNTISSTGKINNSFELSGQYVTLSSLYSIVNRSQLGISAWVYLDPAIIGTVDRMAILGRTYGSNSSYRPGGLHWQSDTTGSFDFHVNLNGVNYILVSNHVVDTLGWYHVVGTWRRNDSIQIYVNGNLSGEMATTDYDCVGSTNDSYIGLRTGSGFGGFYGKIDDLRIYNKKLTHKEVMLIYNYGNGTEKQNFENKSGFFFT